MKIKRFKVPRKNKKIFKVKLDTWNKSHESRLPYCKENFLFLMKKKKVMVVITKFK